MVAGGRDASAPGAALRLQPATRARWRDLEKLFGARGACAGCWCMWWRLRGAAWRAGRGEKNRAALRALTARRGAAPGLLAYAGREPVGWIALAPRAEYPRLAHSRVLAPVDDQPVWSITCFFIAPPWRGRGVAAALLEGAAAFARRNGARALEGYPVDTRGQRTAGVFVFTGTASLFARAGFAEVARRSATRPIVRRTLRGAAFNAAPGRRGSPAPPRDR